MANWIPCQKAADICGVHYATMRTLALTGKVKSTRAGLGRKAKILIAKEEVPRIKRAYDLRKSK